LEASSISWIPPRSSSLPIRKFNAALQIHRVGASSNRLSAIDHLSFNWDLGPLHIHDQLRGTPTSRSAVSVQIQSTSLHVLGWQDSNLVAPPKLSLTRLLTGYGPRTIPDVRNSWSFPPRSPSNQLVLFNSNSGQKYFHK
jgi:hypothetical protein